MCNDNMKQNLFCNFRQKGAILVDNLEIANIDVILNATGSGEDTALQAEFKLSLNAYLKSLVAAPVRTLADVIAFNNKFSDLETITEFRQEFFLAADVTNGMGLLKSKLCKA